MKNNREAYAVIDLDDKQLEQVKREWNRWVNHSRQYLYSLDEAIEIMSRREKSFMGKLVQAIKKAIGIG